MFRMIPGPAFLTCALFAVLAIRTPPASAQDLPVTCRNSADFAASQAPQSLSWLASRSTAIVDAYIESVLPDVVFSDRRRESNIRLRVQTVLKGAESLREIEVAPGYVFEPRNCGTQYIPGQRYIIFLNNERPARLAELPVGNVPRFGVTSSVMGMLGVVNGTMRLCCDDRLRGTIEALTPEEVIAAIRTGKDPVMKDIPLRVVVEGGGPIPRLAFSLHKTAGTVEATPNLQVAVDGRVITLTGNPAAVSSAPASTLQDIRFRLRLPSDVFGIEFSAPLPPGYSVKSLTSDGIDLLHAPLNVSEATGEIALTFAVTSNVLHRVAGRVTDSNQRVTLTGAGLALPLNAPVGSDGSFAFDNVPQGAYTVWPSPLGGGQSVPVIVSERDIDNVTFPGASAGNRGGRGNNRPGRPRTSFRVVVDGPESASTPSYEVVIEGVSGGVAFNRSSGASSDSSLSMAFEPGERISVRAPGYDVRVMMGRRNLLEAQLAPGEQLGEEITIVLSRQPPATGPLP